MFASEVSGNTLFKETCQSKAGRLRGKCLKASSILKEWQEEAVWGWRDGVLLRGDFKPWCTCHPERKPDCNTDGSSHAQC